jgi:hypothetical protein
MDTISFPYFMYKVLINNDLFNIEIDLIKKYPNYEYINKYDKETYFVLTKSNDTIGLKGDIIKLDTEKIENQSNIKYIIYKKNEYKLANQMDLDKYYYFLNIKNDNSKLFRYFYNYLLFYYKNEHNEKKEKDLRIKNKYNETLL